MPVYPQYIEADHLFRVTGMEVDHIIGAMPRDAIEQIFYERSVRINYGYAIAGMKVRHNHVAHERIFPTPDFPKITMLHE